MDVPNFHCLFSFFEEDSFAVGDLKWVNLSGCGVSRDKLNPQHWKKDTVITVRWPDKKGQYQLYPAKILKMSGKLSFWTSVKILLKCLFCSLSLFPTNKLVVANISGRSTLFTHIFIFLSYN